MRTNCAPLLADLVLHSYEAIFFTETVIYNRGDFPFICSNIPSARAFGVSQIIHYAITTQTFCIMLNYLQLGFWNRGMLLQD